MTLAAVVPAAGYSSRMGDFKPLLPLGGTTVLGRVAQTLRQAGVERVVVVTGHRAPEVEAHAAALGLESIFNPEYDAGMFGSLRRGLSALGQGADAALLLPVDIPLVRPQTIRAAIRAQTPETAVAYPCFRGERGHPPVIAGRHIPFLLSWRGEGGMRGALDALERREPVLDVPVPDAGVLFDLDTPRDYAAALERAPHLDAASQEEALVLLEMHRVPPRGLAHARAVAALALALAEALNAARGPAGPALDLECVTGAALLHDLAKGQPEHEKTGGHILECWGMERTARVVAAHRDVAVPGDGVLTELEIVYLADKCMRGDRAVTIQERFGEKLRLYAQDPQAVAAITGRLRNAQAMRRAFLAATGSDPEVLARASAREALR